MDSNRLLHTMFIIVLLGVVPVVLLSAKETYNYHAHFVWTAPANSQDIIGYGVMVREHLGGVLQQTVTPTNSVYIELPWMKQVEVAVVPISRDFIVWSNYWSDWSDTSVWNKVGLEIFKDGDTLTLRSAPITLSLFSSNNLETWSDAGTITGTRNIPIPNKGKQFWKVK